MIVVDTNVIGYLHDLETVLRLADVRRDEGCDEARRLP